MFRFAGNNLDYKSILLLLAIGLNIPFVSAQKVWDYYGEPEKGITVTGIVKGDVGSASSGSIKIYRNGTLFHEVFPGAGGRYEADLPFDSDYEMEFIIPGNVTKRIKVETNITQDLQDFYDEPLSFNVALPKATGGPLDEAYKMPVTRLYFDRTSDVYTRDMVTEDLFRSNLKAKQAEHKRWLEQQNKKQDEEALKKAEEERLRKEREAQQKKEEAEARKREMEDRRRMQEQEFLKKQEDERLKKEALKRQREIEDSLYKANEKQVVEKVLKEKEEIKQQQEQEDQLLWEKITDNSAELAAKRKREISDSIFVANQAKTASSGPNKGTAGGGPSVFFSTKLTEVEKAKDYSAEERYLNWVKKRQEAEQKRTDRLERLKNESKKVSSLDNKRREEILLLKKQSEERKQKLAQLAAEKEAEAERVRKEALAEVMNEKVISLVAYSSAGNSNSKYFGYVNYGNGKGRVELTEEEYKSLSAKYKDIYSKEP